MKLLTDDAAPKLSLGRRLTISCGKVARPESVGAPERRFPIARIAEPPTRLLLTSGLWDCSNICERARTLRASLGRSCIRDGHFAR